MNSRGSDWFATTTPTQQTRLDPTRRSLDLRGRTVLPCTDHASDLSLQVLGAINRRLTAFINEVEVLFARNSKFRIVKVNEGKGGKIVDVEYITP